MLILHILGAGLCLAIAWMLFDKAPARIDDDSPIGPVAMGAAILCVAAAGALLYAGLA